LIIVWQSLANRGKGGGEEKMGPPYFSYLFSHPEDGLKFSQKSFELGMHPQLINRN
jgi:hypothetical protein